MQTRPKSSWRIPDGVLLAVSNEGTKQQVGFTASKIHVVTHLAEGAAGSMFLKPANWPIDTGFDTASRPTVLSGSKWQHVGG